MVVHTGKKVCITHSLQKKIQSIETATSKLHTLCMIAVSEIVSKGNVERLGIKNINTIGWIEEYWMNPVLDES